ncbi:hypothetical protein GGX14DRAFT_563799 [Mycena pura]|uniref:Uncharacterized protein n=1 Tax=Mycena pura TaxID=153505 RepID=A0AAD6YDJ3_9AGAR|nr:hypothetical protein GGX14DRAFT_563799 [Mycena pura]
MDHPRCRHLCPLHIAAAARALCTPPSPPVPSASGLCMPPSVCTLPSVCTPPPSARHRRPLHPPPPRAVCTPPALLHATRTVCTSPAPRPRTLCTPRTPSARLIVLCNYSMGAAEKSISRLGHSGDGRSGKGAAREWQNALT